MSKTFKKLEAEWRREIDLRISDCKSVTRHALAIAHSNLKQIELYKKMLRERKQH